MQSDSLTLKTVAQIVLSFNNLLVNKKLASVNINVADLLNGNYILLLFVVLALAFVWVNYAWVQFNLVIPLAF